MLRFIGGGSALKSLLLTVINLRGDYPLFDPALFVLRQSTKHLPEMRPQLPVQHLSSILRYEHEVVFAAPFRVV